MCSEGCIPTLAAGSPDDLQKIWVCVMGMVCVLCIYVCGVCCVYVCGMHVVCIYVCAVCVWRVVCGVCAVCMVCSYAVVCGRGYVWCV